MKLSSASRMRLTNKVLVINWSHNMKNVITEAVLMVAVTATYLWALLTDSEA